MIHLPRDLGDGLCLRAATPADADALATFNADVIRLQDAPTPQASLGEWTRDLVEGRHPRARASDATIVEDTRTGAIVSSMILLAQSWGYGGVPIPVGQPELVGTRAEYRGHGLVRAQFEVVHARSHARGDLMQAIAGVPWFYRQFGYEMAIPRGGGSMLSAGEAANLPPAPDGLRVRAADERDVAFLTALDVEAASRHALWVPRDEAAWRYELCGHRESSAVRQVIAIVEREEAQPVGSVIHGHQLFGSGSIGVTQLETKAGASWRAVAVAAVHRLREAGMAMAARDGKTFAGVGFWFLGREHPVHEVFRLRFADTSYALYARVADIVAFLRAVTPALEQRLAASRLAGHTAELRLGFYRGGARLVLEQGRVKTVERWQSSKTVVGQENGWGTTDLGRPHALFPDLTFLQLLFGLRAVDELTGWYPDCIVRTAEARALLNALFPRQPSIVWPIL